MKKKSLKLIRLYAVLFVAATVAYFYVNIFAPTLLPRFLRAGTLRQPINVLILGSDITYDYITGKPMPKVRGRSDTIVLAHFDPLHYKLNLLSIPRDTYAAIPGYYSTKINAANVHGGPELAKQTVENLTGQKIDYYIEIHPEAIIKIVDLCGGVIIYVDKDMYYTDRAQKLKIDLKKGWHKMSGTEAHEYIRFRHDAMGDLGRVERQQTFFRALTKALTKPSGIVKMPFVIQAGLREIETNLPLGKMVQILNFMRMLGRDDITAVTLPGTPQNVPGAGSIWVVDKEELGKITEKYF